MEQTQQDQQQIAPYTEFFSWGSDSYGQLALANSDEDEPRQYNQRNTYFDQPKSLSFDIIISQISCGDYHAAFLSGDGFLFSVGRNTEGQLGVGDSSLPQSSAPLLVDSLPKTQPHPKYVSCGGSHTMAIMDNGDLYSWGSSHYGQTAQGSLNNSYQPIKVTYNNDKNTKFSFVDCGKKHSLLIDFQGKVFVCGDNQFRQLGVPHKDRVLELTLLPEFNNKAKQVAAGIDHSLILTQNDQVFSVGNNITGNLGLGHTYSSDNFLQVHGLNNLQIKQISAGRHSAAITQEGRLFVWGPVFRDDTPLLLPQELRANKLMFKVSIGEKQSVIIDQDNQLYMWGIDNRDGDNSMPQLVDALAIKVVTKVDVGLDFVIALGQDFNEYGYPTEEVQQQQQYMMMDEIQPVKPEIYDIRDDSSIRGRHDNYQTNLNNIEQTHYQDRDLSRSPYHTNSKYTAQNDNSNKVNFDKSPISNQTQKPPTQKIDEKPHHFEVNQRNKEVGDMSSISDNSIRTRGDPTFQYSHIINKKDESQISSSYQVPSQIQTNPIVVQQRNNGVTNADLYKQLDISREENHQLKQKNRELMQKVNKFQSDQEQVLSNADQEIKRMSEFIDQYTKEVEVSKKEMEKDFEIKLQQERRKTEELKQKIHNDQNELDAKLDRLQREIEKQRQDNLQLQQDKSDLTNKNKQIQEQLEILQQKLQQQPQRYEKERATPIQTTDYFQYKEQQLSKSPISSSQNYQNLTQSRQPATFGMRDTFEPQIQQRDEFKSVQKDRSYYEQRTRESQSPLVNMKQGQQTQFYTINQEQSKPLREQSYNRPLTIFKREEPSRNERESPKKISSMLGITSPIRENIAIQSLQPTDYVKSPYTNSEPREIFRRTNDSSQKIYQQKPTYFQQFPTDENTYSSQHQNERSSIMKSPMKNSMDEAYQMHQKLQQQLNNNSTYSPNMYNRRDEKENTVSKSEVSGSALNDVKTRLVAMQKNKEELEEKLKTYEAKIKQHFNR